MGDRLAENKRTVLAFYDLAFNEGRPAAAVETYVGDTYTEHDPAVADGKDGVIDHFTRMAAEHPGKRARFVRMVAEGNYVVLHSRQAWPGGPDRAAVDIFRLDEGGKVVEHWGVVQAVPDRGANDNGMV